ncbi:hypothetical protein UFOVP775_35 [uncultured Caudovirales phage]|uniref:Uncharacterized protein n=1 Tax=uncultured Caudovirales phage TaxID=2100421 RepID=A0A6J5NZ81_9CAUD|nr:hypothetical protein UFOVP775_35 [uncultured Caudovirales phage]
MANSQSVLSAAQGTFILNTTDRVAMSCDAIVALEDTIFASIQIGESDVTYSYIQDPSVAVKAGAILRPLNGAKFTQLELTSGSVILVL